MTQPPVTISGDVDLHDELGSRLPEAGKVTVTLHDAGSAVAAETETDATGGFALELPEEGGYSLTFQRAGFGTMVRSSVDGSERRIDADLYARSSAQVASAVAASVNCGTQPCLALTLDVHNFFGPSTTRRLFRVFLSTDPDVGPLSYEESQLLVVPNNDPALRPNGSAATIELSPLHGFLLGFSLGSEVHLAVYGATENLSNSYVDPATGLEVYTDLSESHATASFIVLDEQTLRVRRVGPPSADRGRHKPLTPIVITETAIRFLPTGL